jgi:hypothetical protein
MSSCGTCGQIGPEEKWAEAVPQMPTTPAPPNFERLQWTGLSAYWFSGENVYRCEACGAYFFLTIDSTSTPWSSEYEDYTLTRQSGAASKSEEAARLRAFECCQAGDFAGLEQLLADEQERLAVLQTLAALVTERNAPGVDLERPAAAETYRAKSAGADLTPLEPRLRGFLAGPPHLAGAAARALARHLLGQARQDELQSLLASGGPAKEGAVQALRDARNDNDGFGQGADDAVRALMLHHVRTRDWKAAIALVEDHRAFLAAAGAIRDIAQGALDVSGPVDLSPLKRVLSGKARRARQAPAWAGQEDYEAAVAALEAMGVPDPTKKRAAGARSGRCPRGPT